MKALTMLITAAVLSGTASFAPTGAQAPAPAGAPVAAAEAWEAAIRSLPPHELKRFYLACGRASDLGTLARDRVIVCSVAYDALLAGSFGGDYLALRAWSQDRARADAASAPLAPDPALAPTARLE